MDDERWAEYAREFGALAVGRFRVLVLEGDGRFSHFDADAFDQARQYALDAASEDAENMRLAWVFNDRFEVVFRGRHYATS